MSVFPCTPGFSSVFKDLDEENHPADIKSWDHNSPYFLVLKIKWWVSESTTRKFQNG